MSASTIETSNGGIDLEILDAVEMDGSPVETDQTSQISRPQQKVIGRVRKETTNQQERFKALSPVQKTSACIERQTPVFYGPPKPESKETAEERVVVIAIPIDQIDELKSLLSTDELSLALSPNAIRSDADEIVTIQRLCPTYKNALALSEKINAQRLKAQVNILNAETITPSGIIAAGNLISATDQRLFQHIPSESNSLQSHRTGLIDKRGDLNIKTNVPEVLDTDKIPTAKISKAALAFAETFETKLPEGLRGNCAFMVFNPHELHDLKNPERMQTALEQFGRIAKSQDFFVTNDSLGNIVVLGMEERSGGALSLLAKNIQKNVEKPINIFLGLGRVENNPSGLVVEDYPDLKSLSRLRSAGAGNPAIRASKAFSQANIEGRHGSLAKLKVHDDRELEEVSIVESIKPLVRLRRNGGPDRYVGNKTELEKLRKALGPNSHTKLVTIKAKAGMGKSRLVDEIVQEHQDAIVISADASGENLPGDAMIKIAAQIYAQIAEKFPKNLAAFASLNDFISQDEAAQGKAALEHPGNVASLIYETLKEIERLQGGLTLVYDDIHHNDRHSDGHLMKMVQRLLLNSSAKAVLLMRPEERYRSSEQEALETTIQSRFASGLGGLVGTLKKEPPVVNIEPVLNLKDLQTVRDYAFYSLPEEKRTQNNSNQKILHADWHMQIVEHCSTPLEMTEILNILLADEGNLLYTDETIALSSEGKKVLAAITADGDLKTYQERKLAALDQSQRTLLEVMAIFGNRLSIGQLQKVLGAVGVSADPKDLLAQLTKTGHVVETRPEEFQLWHDTVRETIIEQMAKQSKTTAENLAERIETILTSGQRTLSAKQRFHLLSFPSKAKPIINLAFWERYTAVAQESLMEAINHGNYTQAYGQAMNILDKLDPGSSNTINTALSELTPGAAGDMIPENVATLICEALVVIAEQGVNLGHFQEAQQAIDLLVKINKPNYLKRAYLAQFELGYINFHKDQMANAMTAMETARSLNPQEKLLLDIKLEFKTAGDNAEAIAACLGKFPIGETRPEYVRLKQRIEFEAIRTKLISVPGPDGKTIDGDVYMDPGFLDRNQCAELFKIRFELAQLNERRKSNQKMSKPQMSKPLEELYLLEQLAQIASMLGNYQEAASAFSDLWITANQMQIPYQAARAAKMKGDLLVLSAMASVKAVREDEGSLQKGSLQPREGAAILREHLFKAIDVYSKEGLQQMEKVDQNNFYHTLLRMQRLRAVSLVIETYENEIAACLDEEQKIKDFPEYQRVKAELAPFLALAVDDLEYIETNNPKLANNQKYSGYYIATSFGKITEAIELFNVIGSDLGKPANPNLLEDPFLATDVLVAGLQEAQGMKDHAGEVKRKKNNLRIVARQKADKLAARMEVGEAITPKAKAEKRARAIDLLSRKTEKNTNELEFERLNQILQAA